MNHLLSRDLFLHQLIHPLYIIWSVYQLVCVYASKGITKGGQMMEFKMRLGCPQLPFLPKSFLTLWWNFVGNLLIDKFFTFRNQYKQSPTTFLSSFFLSKSKIEILSFVRNKQKKSFLFIFFPTDSISSKQVSQLKWILYYLPE